MPCRAVYAVAALVLLEALGAAALRAGEVDRPVAAAEAPSASMIAGWINELEADSYAVREQASRRLVAAGMAALPALQKAAAGRSSEAAVRAVAALEALYLEDDLAVQSAAEEVLESVMLSAGSLGRSLADDTLQRVRLSRTAQTVAKLRELGAEIANLNDVLIGDLRRGGDLQVLLKSRYNGGDAGLVWLRRLPQLRQVKIHSAPITDTAIDDLEKLTRLQELQLFGTKITPLGLARLKRALPNTDIDFRGGGLLGIGGDPRSAPCLINTVAAGQAADRAGILPGDVILSLDGEALATYGDFMNQIRPKTPGEKVKLSIRRGADVLEFTVELGSW